MLNEFYFPLKREQLTERPSDNRFWIEDYFMLEDIDDKELINNLQKNFDAIQEDFLSITNSANSNYIFSVLKDFRFLSPDVKNYFIENLTESFKNFLKNLDDIIELNDFTNQNHLNIGIKIYIFYIEWLIENHLNDLKSKKKEIKKGKKRGIKENKEIGFVSQLSKKKNNSSSSSKKLKQNAFNFENNNNSNNHLNPNEKNQKNYNFDLLDLLNIISKVNQINIKKIFKNKIINEDFLNSLIKICFDTLEILNETKNSHGNGKEKIFEILQVIVTKYQNVQILLLKLTTKIVELIFNQENLVNNLSDFISLAIQGTDSNMNKLAIDIVQEISKIVHQHQNENSNSSDSQGIKNVGKFLVNLSEKSPKIMHNNISCLITLFNCEAYVIRNSLLEILGNIIVLILCKTDDIPDVDMRNSYLRAKEKYIDILFDRIYDKNSYCRSKVLQIFEKLCENNCITMSNYYRLIDEASKRLKDDKSQVRKKAISIINRIIIIYSQIFKTNKFLTVIELEKILSDTNDNIKKLEEEVKRIETRQIEISIKFDKNENVNNDNNNNKNKYKNSKKNKLNKNKDNKNKNSNSISESESQSDENIDEENNNENKMDLVKEEENYDDENENDNYKYNEEILNQEKILKKEEINKETEYLHFFDNYKRVVTSINRIVPIAILLIGSKNSSDVIQTIELIVSLHKFRINSSFEGIRKMLTLFIKPEESIKKKLIEAYRDLFFDSDKNAEMQAAYLVSLAINLNFSEKKCLKEMMKLLIETKSFTNNNIFKEIWKIFLRNPTDEILKFNFSTKKEANEKLLTLAEESRTAIQILNFCADTDEKILLDHADLFIKFIHSVLQRKYIDYILLKECLIGLQKIYKMKNDKSEFCLMKIAKLIMKTLGTMDNNWFLCAQELYDTIFLILSHPDLFCQYIIFRLTNVLLSENNYINNNIINERQFLGLGLNSNLNLNSNSIFPSTSIDLSQNFSQIKIDKDNIKEDDNKNVKMEIDDEDNPAITISTLSQVIFSVGQIALNMVGYCEKLENNLKSKTKKIPKGEKSEKDIEKEKDENNKKKKQKNKKQGKDSQSEDEEDEMQKINGGQEAEVEHDIQILQKIVDEDLLYKNILGKFTPFILNIVTNIFTDNITDENKILYKTSIISLCKFMCVSKKFCEENLQILFDILENEKIEANLKLNICVSIGDLVNRFPNLLQKKIGDFFNCLKSSDIYVVRNSMIVISHLVLNDMIKLKGEIVEICLLLELNNEKLNDLVNLFISEYNKKGQNVIYNVIPKALARLNNEYKHLDYSKFQNVVKNLLKFVEKDKQTDGLIEKLFGKLKNSTNKKEWRNTTFCLSLLNYNEKGLNKVLELFGNLKEKIDDDIVNENFANIFAKYKKTSTGINKENLEDIEKKFFADGKVNLNINKNGRTIEKNSGRIGSKRTNSNMKSGLKNNIGRSRSKTKNIKEGSDEDYDEDDYDENHENNLGSKRNNKGILSKEKNNINLVKNVNNINDNNNISNSARRSLRKSKTIINKRKDSFIDEDEDND